MNEVTEVALPTVFMSEAFGTAVLVLLGCGVVANVVLPRTKGNGADWVLISFGWGFAVFAGVYVAHASGAHLNPAVTVGMLAADKGEYAPGVAITAASTVVYLVAQFVGGMVGALVCWLAYKKHFDEAGREGVPTIDVFSTGPEIRSYGWNFVTEVIATFVLVYVILVFGQTPSELGPLAVAVLVVAIGMSLGGPTGYAINPARDLSPRIVHALLPIRGKLTSNWSYAWVPVLGPLVGGALAGVAAAVIG
ncbi:aquaporin family protein [Kocuria tytonicola]|uniref:MIP/aquaporin family protein n=1 Tax=Kocuria tytonicola TaxID=2055946 RepID=UPI000EF90D32|nr:MIP/aquaporin family protein [Kocuria tytonicola]RLZ02931.1 aquaporin family protein [Kocuria tytonicola]